MLSVSYTRRQLCASCSSPESTWETGELQRVAALPSAHAGRPWEARGLEHGECLPAGGLHTTPAPAVGGSVGRQKPLQK